MVLRLKARKSRSPPGLPNPPQTRPRDPCPGLNPSRRPATHDNAGWSSPVARQAHNLKVEGSNPSPATKIVRSLNHLNQAPEAQQLRAFLCPADVRKTPVGECLDLAANRLQGAEESELPAHGLDHLPSPRHNYHLQRLGDVLSSLASIIGGQSLRCGSGEGPLRHLGRWLGPLLIQSPIFPRKRFSCSSGAR
jgi:hypothetical protein